MKKEQLAEIKKESSPNAFLISRKLWVALAHDQLKRRKRYLGVEFAKPCSTCIEILMCEGPIGKGICTAVNEMQDIGMLKGPQRIAIDRRRARKLPVSRSCLEAYGILKQGK